MERESIWVKCIGGWVVDGVLYQGAGLHCTVLQGYTVYIGVNHNTEQTPLQFQSTDNGYIDTPIQF